MGKNSGTICNAWSLDGLPWLKTPVKIYRFVGFLGVSNQFEEDSNCKTRRKNNRTQRSTNWIHPLLVGGWSTPRLPQWKSSCHSRLLEAAFWHMTIIAKKNLHSTSDDSSSQRMLWTCKILFKLSQSPPKCSRHQILIIVDSTCCLQVACTKAILDAKRYVSRYLWYPASSSRLWRFFDASLSTSKKHFRQRSWSFQLETISPSATLAQRFFRMRRRGISSFWRRYAAGWTSSHLAPNPNVTRKKGPGATPSSWLI